MFWSKHVMVTIMIIYCFFLINLFNLFLNNILFKLTHCICWGIGLEFLECLNDFTFRAWCLHACWVMTQAPNENHLGVRCFSEDIEKFLGCLFIFLSWKKTLSLRVISLWITTKMMTWMMPESILLTIGNILYIMEGKKCSSRCLFSLELCNLQHRCMVHHHAEP